MKGDAPHLLAAPPPLDPCHELREFIVPVMFRVCISHPFQLSSALCSSCHGRNRLWGVMAGSFITMCHGKWRKHKVPVPWGRLSRWGFPSSLSPDQNVNERIDMGNVTRIFPERGQMTGCGMIRLHVFEQYVAVYFPIWETDDLHHRELPGLQNQNDKYICR